MTGESPHTGVRRASALGLIASLLPYIRHDTTCDSHKDEGSGPCTCGLEAAHNGYRAQIPCSVCVGQPLSGGRECICGGVGTEIAEMQGLRERCFELENTVAQLRGEPLPWPSLRGTTPSEEPEEEDSCEEERMRLASHQGEI